MSNNVVIYRTDGSSTIHMGDEPSYAVLKPGDLWTSHPNFGVATWTKTGWIPADPAASNKEIVENLQKRISELEYDLAQADHHLRDLNNAATQARLELQGNVNRLRGSLNQAQSEKAELRSQLNTMISRRNRLCKEADNLKSNNTSLRSRIVMLEGRVRSLQIENIELRTERDAALYAAQQEAQGAVHSAKISQDGIVGGVPNAEKDTGFRMWGSGEPLVLSEMPPASEPLIPQALVLQVSWSTEQVETAVRNYMERMSDAKKSEQ